MNSNIAWDCDATTWNRNLMSHCRRAQRNRDEISCTYRMCSKCSSSFSFAIDNWMENIKIEAKKSFVSFISEDVTCIVRSPVNLSILILFFFCLRYHFDIILLLISAVRYIIYACVDRRFRFQCIIDGCRLLFCRYDCEKWKWIRALRKANRKPIEKKLNESFKWDWKKIFFFALFGEKSIVHFWILKEESFGSSSSWFAFLLRFIFFFFYSIFYHLVALLLCNRVKSMKRAEYIAVNMTMLLPSERQFHSLSVKVFLILFLLFFIPFH